MSIRGLIAWGVAPQDGNKISTGLKVDCAQSAFIIPFSERNLPPTLSKPVALFELTLGLWTPRENCCKRSGMKRVGRVLLRNPRNIIQVGVYIHQSLLTWFPFQTRRHTVDEQNPATKKPWNDPMPQRQYRPTLWFQSWLRLRNGFRHHPHVFGGVGSSRPGSPALSPSARHLLWTR